MRISQLSGNKLNNIARKTSDYMIKPLESGAETAGKAAGKAVVGTAKFCVGNLMGTFYAAGGIVTGISPGLKLLEYGYKAIGRKDLAQKYKEEQNMVTVYIRDAYKHLGVPKSGIFLTQSLGNIFKIIKSI